MRKASRRAADATPLTIRTSDGLAVTGESLDPVRAANEFTQLERFTHFLARRVVTEHLAMLRMLLAEYFCHRDTHLKAFLAQSATPITIVPVALGGVQAGDRIDLVLPPTELASVAPGRSASALTYLFSRVRTTQCTWLVKMFVEFCDGHDTTLCEFISASARTAICILPTPCAVGSTSFHATESAMPCTGDEPQRLPRPPPRRTARWSTDTTVAVDRDSVDPSDDDDNASLDSDVGATIHAVIQAPGRARTDPETSRMRRQLQEHVALVEATEPWRQAFPTDMALPPGVETHPELVDQLQDFWQKHRRAVWERNFWVPLSSEQDWHLHGRRRHRQRVATQCFERITLQCYEALGAKFFYRLDKKGKRHPGWWYRAYLVDLLSLAGTIGLEKTMQYVDDQQLERFPNCGQPLPIHSANLLALIHHRQRNHVTPACWSQKKDPAMDKMRKRVAKYLEKKARRGECE